MNRLWNNRILPSVMYIILGMIVMLWPVGSFTVLSLLVGWSLVIYGIAQVAQAFYARGTGIVNRSILTGGLIPLILGIIIVAYPGTLAGAVRILFGLVMLFSGAVNVYLAWKGRFPGWAVSFCLNLLISVCGLVILINPFTLIRWIGFIMGLAMILTGVSGLDASHRK